MKGDVALADKTKRTSDSNSVAPDIDPWKGEIHPAFGNWARPATTWMKAVSDFSQEILALSQNRLAYQYENLRELATCRTPPDFWDRQRQFMQMVVRRYMEDAAWCADEANKMAWRVLGALSAGAPASNPGPTPEI